MYKEDAIFSYLTDDKKNQKNEIKILQNYNSVFKTIKIVGRGNFGQTYLIEDNYGNQYALKVFFNLTMRDYQREVQNLIQLTTPTCPKDLVCYMDHFILNNKYTILSNYIEGQTLDCFEHRFDNQQVKYIALWLLHLLSYLHSRGFAHNDISTGNIILTPTGHLKLIDFGLSCRFKTNEINKCSVVRLVNQQYISPELRSGRYKLNVDKYSKTSDVYAAGLVLLSLLKTRPDPCLITIIKQLLIHNPDLRMTAANAYTLLTKCNNQM